MKSIFKKIRLSRKVTIIVAGVLVLSGASGGYVVYSDKAAATEEDEAASSQSGLACSVVETLKMRRNGQRWIRKYVTTEASDGIERVRTALRIAGLLATQEKADLYQVAVLDEAGPKDRANRRGPAIGAEVLFAPDPAQLPGMDGPFVARYTDARANSVGLFYGTEVALSTGAIRDTITAIDDRSDCIDPVAIAAKAAAEAEAAHGAKSAASGHGEAASEHGEASADHGAEPSEHGQEPAAHGEEAPAGHGEEAQSGHGEETPAHGEAATPAHGDEPAASAEAAGDHGPAPEKKGFFGSIIAMVLGDGDKTPAHGDTAAEKVPEDHGEAPAGDHAVTEDAPPSHDETDATAHGEETSPGHGEAPPAHDNAGEAH